MGQHSRPSSNLPPGFQGGQTRLYRRVPKFGFSNKKFKLSYQPLSLEKIQYFIDSGRIQNTGAINLKTLLDSGCISRLKYPGIKITSVGAEHFKAKIELETTRISAKALKKIEENGGSVRTIFFSKKAILALKKLKKGEYNPEELMKKMSLPPPKLFRYYMREDMRGYLCETNPIHPLRDVVPPEESAKEREKGMIRLFNLKKSQMKDSGKEKKKSKK